MSCYRYVLQEAKVCDVDVEKTTTLSISVSVYSWSLNGAAGSRRHVER